MLHDGVTLIIELEFRRLNGSLSAIHCFVHVYISTCSLFLCTINFTAYLKVNYSLAVQ